MRAARRAPPSPADGAARPRAAALGPARGRRRRARAPTTSRGDPTPSPEARNTCSAPSGDVGADRQRAPRAQLGEEAALDLDGVARRGVVDGGQQLGRRASSARPRRRRTPARRRARTARRSSRSAMRSVSPSTCEGGDRHHDGAAVGHPLETGGDVAAELDEPQVRADGGELRPPAHRPGRHAWRPAPSSASVRPTSASAASRRRRKAPIVSAVVGDRREVLGRVHGGVGAAVEHGLLHLLDEHALAADRRAAARPGGGRRWSRRAPARRRSPSPAAAVGDALGLGRGPAGCRGWPGGRRRRTARSAQVEQVAHRGRVALALRRPGVVAQAHRRSVQQLGDDRPGERLDGLALGRRRGRRGGRRSAPARAGGPARRARAAGRRAGRPDGPWPRRGSARAPRRRSCAPGRPRPERSARPRSAQSRRSSRSST